MIAGKVGDVDEIFVASVDRANGVIGPAASLELAQELCEYAAKCGATLPDFGLIWQIPPDPMFAMRPDTFHPDGPPIHLKIPTWTATGKLGTVFKVEKFILERDLDPAPVVVQGEPIIICRECRDGKHGNCDGSAWDFELDEMTSCGCQDPIHA